jgi:acetyltransferase
MGIGDIKRMLNPETIALIGATEKEGAAGRDILENLYYWSRERKIFPVNPKRKTVLGLECYPSILNVPERIDLSVIATPSQTVPKIVEECGKAEVGGIIIISTGFKEVGEEGEKLEEEIKGIRDQYGMRIMGPNCLGVIRPNIGLNTSLLKAVPERGNIAFISQTGALGGAIFDWAIHAHVGFSMFASLGSMIDVDFGDLIDFLGSDPYTRSIMLYMEEGIGNAKKFMSAVKGFARYKPIIVVKPGRFTERPKPALSHTGHIVSRDQVYDAAFKRVSVVRVKEVSDLFNTVRALHSKHLPKGMKLAIVTNAKGVGVMATDTLIELGGRLATLSDESLKKLNSFLPSYWGKANPVDVLRDADIERYVNAVNICLNDSAVDGVLIIYTLQDRAKPNELAKAITEISKKAWKPMITTWMGGKEVEEGRKILFQYSIPTYETPEEAVKSYLYLYHYVRSLELLYETPAELSVDQPSPKNNLKGFIRRAVKEGKIILHEEESKRFLINYGIPIIPSQFAQNVDNAIQIAKKIGYPLVLRIVVPDISCKSDVGGTVIGINSDEKLREEYDKLIQRVKESAPKSKIEGVTVQKMIEKIDYEIILGAKKDKDFGPVILFGMGGIGVHLFKDFSVGLPPMNQTLARRLIEETEVYRMIQGYDRKPPADLKQLEQIIISFSNLIADFPEIAEMDINPLVISNGKAYALDARIILDQESLEYKSQYPHLVITPYPIRYVMQWRLSDGAEVILRPIKPEDELLVRDMLATLSEETLKERFFQIIKSITHEMLIKLCNIDYDREMTIVAEVREDQKRKLIGIGGLMIEPDFTKGEFAVVVHDIYQGKGLGYKLINILIGIAQEKGLEEFYGFVLPNNRRMLRLCQKLGFNIKPLPDDITIVKLLLR